MNEIREYRNAQPFRPFRLILADGRKLLVTEPGKIGWHPEGRSLSVYTHFDTLHRLQFEDVVKVLPVSHRNGKAAERRAGK